MPLEAALQVHRGLLDGVPLRRLLLVVARRAQAVLGASLLVAICTPAEDGTGHAVRSAIGRGAAHLRGWTIPADAADIGVLLRGRESRVLALDEGSWPAYLPPGLAGRLGSAMLVPAVVQQRTRGLLFLANVAGGRSFGDPDLAMAELLATQVAVAIEFHGARADVAQIELVADIERIEAELHDGIAQTLYGVGLSLQAALPMAQQPELRARLEGAIRDLDQAVDLLRTRTGGQVRPAILADRGLELALRQIVAHYARRTHMTIQVDVEEAAATRAAEHREQLLVVVNERLAELARRADIAHCRIRLYETDDGELAVLELADDGRGIHSEDERLREIQELVADLGVDVQVEIVPEIGATLRAILRRRP